MGRASSSKKVSRAASTGGGRTTRGAKPYTWYLVMGAVVLAGAAIILTSRDARINAAAGDVTPPRAPNVSKGIDGDHWHAAYGAYLCDNFSPPIQDQRDPQGIHTHADGVIHIHPFTSRAAGENATLGKFADAVRMKLSDTEIRLPGDETYKEGDDKCGGKPGIVQVKVNDKLITTNVREITFNDGDLFTIAFAPEGAELPPPPSAPNLQNLTDLPPGDPRAPSTTVAGSAPEVTTPPPTESTTPSEPTPTSSP